jgi:predicted GTPase
MKYSKKLLAGILLPSRQGRQGKIYYGTQVKSQPPTIALFVNDPVRFNDNYRRYIERQFRQQLGFTGTPLRLLWRGKKVREVGMSRSMPIEQLACNLLFLLVGMANDQ